MATYLVLLLLIAATGNTLASEWKYEDEDHWAPKCKEGKEQSPIALSEYTAEHAHFEPLKYKNYDRSFLAFLKNNGHSAEVRLHAAEAKPEIQGGNLSETYVLDHLHFHWQSEHTINSYRFPLELHLVHYAKEHNNLSTALHYPKGVAVFAVLFDLSPDDDSEFKPLLEIIDRLKDQVGQKLSFDTFSVKNFLPRDSAGYYRYDGSLTTPECNEGILWTIFTNTIPISKEQVKVFEEIQTNYKTVLSKNYRSIQPLNDRVVLLRVSPLRSSAKTNQIAKSLLFVLSMFVFFFKF